MSYCSNKCKSDVNKVNTPTSTESYTYTCFLIGGTTRWIKRNQQLFNKYRQETLKCILSLTLYASHLFCLSFNPCFTFSGEFRRITRSCLSLTPISLKILHILHKTWLALEKTDIGISNLFFWRRVFTRQC